MLLSNESALRFYVGGTGSVFMSPNGAMFTRQQLQTSNPVYVFDLAAQGKRTACAVVRMVCMPLLPRLRVAVLARAASLRLGCSRVECLQPDP